jgi:hypothetical protein
MIITSNMAEAKKEWERAGQKACDKALLRAARETMGQEYDEAIYRYWLECIRLTPSATGNSGAA